MTEKSPQATTFDGQLAAAIRQYLRDLPEFRKRFEGTVVFEPDEVDFHLSMAVDRINSITPPTSFTSGTIPFRNWIIRMTAINLMEARLNQLEVEERVTQDPGGITSVPVEFKSLSRRLPILLDQLTREIIGGKAAELMRGYLSNASGVASVYSSEITEI